MFRDELALQLRRRRRVMAELHAELALALRRRAQLRREAEHGVQTAIREEREVLGPDLALVDDGVALVQQADDVALELGGRRDGGLHERLQYHGVARGEGLAEGLLRRVLEGHLGRVRHVGRAVVDHHGRAEHLVPDERALLAGRVEALLAREEELLRDRAARDLLLECVRARPRHDLLALGRGRRGRRLHPPDDAREVARPARLLLERMIERHLLRHRLAVRHLRLSDLAVAAVLAAHALDIDVEVQLTHA